MTTFACTECERTVRTDWEAVTCTSDARTCDPCCDLYGHTEPTEGDPMTATEGCIDAPHDHVDQCHQAGRAEVEAKYAALVAAVEGLAERWESAQFFPGAFYPEAFAYADGRRAQAESCADYLRDLLAYLAEGGDR